MDTLTLLDPVHVIDDIHLIPGYIPLPGAGLLPINAFLIRGREPMLIDAGPNPLAAQFYEALSGLIDLKDLRWVWLTHADPDHVGAVSRVLEAAPKARVVTTYLGAGKMGLIQPLPQERTHLVQAGDRLSIGDRELIALRPPVYDAPETMAVFDTRTRALFSADSFGALLKEPIASATDIPDGALREGLVAWAGIDVPWLENVEEDRMEAVLAKFQSMEPSMVLSGHLPPAPRMIDKLSGHLEAARKAAAPVSAEQSTELFKAAVA